MDRGFLLKITRMQNSFLCSSLWISIADHKALSNVQLDTNVHAYFDDK